MFKKTLSIFLIGNFLLISLSRLSFGELSASEKLKLRADTNRFVRQGTGVLMMVSGAGLFNGGLNIYNYNDNSEMWGTGTYKSFGIILSVIGVGAFLKGISFAFFERADSEIDYENMLKLPVNKKEEYAAKSLLKYEGEPKKEGQSRNPDFEKIIKKNVDDYLNE